MSVAVDFRKASAMNHHESRNVSIDWKRRNKEIIHRSMSEAHEKFQAKCFKLQVAQAFLIKSNYILKPIRSETSESSQFPFKRYSTHVRHVNFTYGQRRDSIIGSDMSLGTTPLISLRKYKFPIHL